jgi:hypothetical protein
MSIMQNSGPGEDADLSEGNPEHSEEISQDEGGDVGHPGAHSPAPGRLTETDPTIKNH